MSLTAAEQRLCKAILARQSQMHAELAQHVAIPTGHNFTQGLDQYRKLIGNRLQKLGANLTLIAGSSRPAWLNSKSDDASAAQTIPPTLLATRTANSNSPRILIAGHLDTVHDPHGDFCEMKIAADGKTATGPGVADMKGGILIGVAALEVLHEYNVDLNWTLLLNSDEETGSFHSFDAIAVAARQHDIGIALEPALPDGSLVVERMGAGQFKIEVFGKAAHVGRDFASGVSAVTKLGEILVALGKLADPKRGRIVNVGPLQGGKATNIVADYAACWGNIRFANEQTARELQQSIDALATDANAMPRVVVHQVHNRPAKPLNDHVQQLANAAHAAAQDLGQQLPFGKTGGVCDGNIMQAAGLPTIDTLGVRGGNLHRNDEFIELASLVERCQLLAILLARIAEGRVTIS